MNIYKREERKGEREKEGKKRKERKGKKRERKKKKPLEIFCWYLVHLF